MLEQGQELSEKQRKFAEMVATGVAAVTAYQRAGYAAKKEAAITCASRLLTNAKVKRYVRALRRKAVDESEEGAVLTLVEKRRWLARVVRTPLSHVTEESDLCQEHTVTTTEAGGSEKIKMPCKLRAMELDAKLAGELRDKAEEEKKTPEDEMTSEERRAQARSILERWGATGLAPKDFAGGVADE